MGSQDVSLTIKANDQASAEIGKIRSEMEKFAPALKNLQDASTNTAQGMSWLTNCHAKYIAVVAAGTQIIQAASAAWVAMKQYINLGAEALRAEEAFGAMAQSIGVDAAKMTADMKQAAAGFVDDSHLMQRAAFAMASDIDPEKIPQVFEAARLAARLTGQDVTTSIDGMIQAISTNMPRSLRQMGMISKEQMTILNQAAAAGVTEVNLLDIVMANATIRAAQLGDSQDNAAKQIKKFQVQIEEVKETIGKGLIVALQKAFGVMQGFAAMALYSAGAVMSLVAAAGRMSTRFMSPGPVKDKDLRIAAEHEATAKDLYGAAEELIFKGAANITGTSEGGAKGPSAADAEKAKANLARLMDDLKKRIAAAKGGGEIDKLREEWARIEREMEADIAKGGLGEFEKKIIDIDKKVEDLKEKAAKLPTEMERTAAGESIASWAAGMKGQIGAEQAREEMLAAREAYENGQKALAEADKWVTEAQATELQKRKDQVAAAAHDQRKAYLEAHEAGILDREEYLEKLTALDEAEKDQTRKLQADYDKTVRESEINIRLAALDLLEKEGTAHRETLTERIALVRELIDAEEEHLATMDKGKDESAWYAQSDKVNAARKSYADLTREMTMTDPFGAVSLAMTNLENQWTDVGQQMYDVAQNTAQAMQQAFSDFFFDIMTGRMKSLGDYVTSFLNSIARSISNVMGQQMSAGIIGIGRSALGFHSGGVVGESAPSFYRIVPNAVFAGAQRYHGGLMSDEFPAILQRGEIVLSRRDVSRLSDTSSQSAAPNVQINMINNSGTNLSGSQQGSPKFDGRKWVLDIVVEGAERYAPLRQTLANMRS